MKLSNLEIMKKIEEAKKFQRLGKLKDAEKVYTDTLKNNSNSFDLSFSYALFSKDLKNYILAKKLLVNLTKKFPSEIRSYIQIADILTLENRYSEAEQVLLIAKNIEPKNSDVLYNFSRLYWSGKNFELSLKNINKAIELNNEIENYKILKADILICKDQLEEALSILEILKNNEKNNKKIQVINLISQIHIKKRILKKLKIFFLK